MLYHWRRQILDIEVETKDADDPGKTTVGDRAERTVDVLGCAPGWQGFIVAKVSIPSSELPSEWTEGAEILGGHRSIST